MLQNLRIKNFALIEDLEMICLNGLNVLTGETGAGKSILIDALNILLGDKAGAGFIRAGTEKAIIEGEFQAKPTVNEWLKSKELIEGEEQETLSVAREITKSGSRFRINGIMVNQPWVSELKQMLVHVHTQHEARTLLSAQSQLNILDGLADQNHHLSLEKINLWHTKKTDLQTKLAEMQMSEEERVRRLDFARFHLEELQAANLTEEDEDEQLSKKQTILANVAQLDSAANTAYQALSGNSAEYGASDTATNNGAIDALQTAIVSLERASNLDSDLSITMSTLHNALTLVEEAQTNLRRYKDNLAIDPDSLQEIEARSAQLATIKRKYGPTLAQAMDRQIVLEQEIATFENAQEQTNKLEKELNSINKKLEELAVSISENRKELARELTDKVKAELSQLGMEHCQFEVSFEKLTEITNSGFDRLEFMISPNPGQPLLPMTKIASGGELSRIMLAIKTIVATLDDPPTVIFDEIDTGLSGRIVQAVRDKLFKLAQSRQILCITHQPIIAAAAHNHLFIEKKQTKENTNVTIRALPEEERVKVLAAMASGHEDETTALDFAQSLLNQQAQVMN